MKILFLSEAPLIKYGLAEGFKQLGHDYMIMSGDNRLWDKGIGEQMALIDRVMATYKPDLVFTEGYVGCDPGYIAEIIHSYHVPFFYWAIEDPVSTDWLSMQYAPHADYIFTTTVECLPSYQSLGKEAEVLLFGCNPEFHKTVEPVEEYKHDIVLVAANYDNRYDKTDWFLLPLLEKGYDIKIWGPFWMDADRPINLIGKEHLYGGILPYEELSRVYNSAKIILGMNCSDISMTQTSMRPYEAMACGGGLFIGHYTKAQYSLFGSLMFHPKDPNETEEYIKTILGMPETTREARAASAQHHVYKYHNYKLRAKQIINAYHRLEGSI